MKLSAAEQAHLIMARAEIAERMRVSGHPQTPASEAFAHNEALRTIRAARIEAKRAKDREYRRNRRAQGYK